MARTRRGAIAALLTTLAVAACQLVVGVKDEEGAQRSAASDDAAPGVDATAEAAVGCVPNVPPAKPATADPTGTTGAPLFFAVRRAFSAANGATVGFDLDGHCTSAGADVPCKGSPNDGDGGADNSFFADFIANLAIPFDVPDPALATTNDNIDAGTDGIFLAVYGYNGLEDDDKVSLAFVSSPGLVSTRCGDAGVEAGPRWDGCDVWSTGQTVILQGLVSNPQAAYVAGGTLVARYGNQELVVRFGGTELRLRDAIVTGKLAKQPGGGYELENGGVTGRAASADLFQTSARVTVKTSSAGNTRHLCETPATIEFIRAKLCPARDLRLAGDDPTAACDGMSIAIGFGASPVAAAVMGPDKPLFECAPFDAACP